jgi:hypothetical protein
MDKKKANDVNESATKISVIDEALLKNIVGGSATRGEIAISCCCECTGK